MAKYMDKIQPHNIIKTNCRYTEYLFGETSGNFLLDLCSNYSDTFSTILKYVTKNKCAFQLPIPLHHFVFIPKIKCSTMHINTEKTFFSSLFLLFTEIYQLRRSPLKSCLDIK